MRLYAEIVADPKIKWRTEPMIGRTWKRKPTSYQGRLVQIDITAPPTFLEMGVVKINIEVPPEVITGEGKVA